jgi:hypothetical protein
MDRAKQEGWDANFEHIWLTAAGGQDDTPGVPRVDASDFDKEGHKLCGDASSRAASGTSSTVAPSTTRADVACDGNQGPNGPMPEFYQEQFSSGVAQSLKKNLAAYDSAVDSGDSQQIGDNAGNLYSEIKSEEGYVYASDTFWVVRPGCAD